MPDDINELALKLDEALDAFGLTILPCIDDQDEPDMGDLKALAARILGKDDE